MPADARRRRKFLQAALAALVAVVGSGVAQFGHIDDPSLGLGDIAPVVGALLILVGGWVAVRAMASAVRDGIRERTGEARAVTLSKIVSMAGFTIVILWTLSALGIGIQALLLGGALTGVVLGIAAQQTLGNIFAGLVLLVVRPFMVGEETVIKSTLGEYKGMVQNIGLFYVTIKTAGGRVDVPNGVALASAVGPGASANAGNEPEALPEGPEQPPA
ncbi:MAG TPA: mechanosensitive ion channel family protein [Actinomycetota bacterium]|nr:mechanosensitive ion channel family protein [Actinomycetota bacterium]